MSEKKDDHETFGDYLKKERNMRGVTLEEIVKKTNISYRFLNAIENDNYDDLPPDVFVKGFLRAYSSSIGIEPNEVILAYSEHQGSKEYDDNGSSDKKIDFIERENNKKIFSLGLLCLFIFFAGLFYYFSLDKTPDNNKKVPAITKKTTGVTEKIAVSSKKKDNKVKEKEKSSPPEKSKIPQVIALSKPGKHIKTNVAISTVAPKTHVLSIYGSETVWIKVVLDDNEPKEALLNEGEQVSYKAEKRFILTLGNIKGSIVTLDGEDLILPETKSQILRNYEISFNKPQDSTTDGQP